MACIFENFGDKQESEAICFYNISALFITFATFRHSIGPMSFYSAYAIEHAIGEIKRKIKS